MAQRRFGPTHGAGVAVVVEGGLARETLFTADSPSGSGGSQLAAPTITPPAESATSFSGTGVPGATIILYIDGALAPGAEITVGQDGTWATDPGAPYAAPEGAHSLTAEQTLNGATSPVSQPVQWVVAPPARTPVTNVGFEIKAIPSSMTYTSIFDNPDTPEHPSSLVDEWDPISSSRVGFKYGKLVDMRSFGLRDLMPSWSGLALTATLNDGAVPVNIVASLVEAAAAPAAPSIYIMDEGGEATPRIAMYVPDAIQLDSIRLVNDTHEMVVHASRIDGVAFGVNNITLSGARLDLQVADFSFTCEQDRFGASNATAYLNNHITSQTAAAISATLDETINQGAPFNPSALLIYETTIRLIDGAGDGHIFALTFYSRGP